MADGSNPIHIMIEGTLEGYNTLKSGLEFTFRMLDKLLTTSKDFGDDKIAEEVWDKFLGQAEEVAEIGMNFKKISVTLAKMEKFVVSNLYQIEPGMDGDGFRRKWEEYLEQKEFEDDFTTQMVALDVKLEALDFFVGGVLEEKERRQRVKRRVTELKKIDAEVAAVKTELSRETHRIWMQFMEERKKKFELRRRIVEGDIKVEEDSVARDCRSGAANAREDESAKEHVIGIPCFWLTIFENVKELRGLIKCPEDYLALEHLTDIEIQSTNLEIGFRLLFHFSPNPFFANPVLTKTFLKKVIFGQHGPIKVLGQTSGCEIEWRNDNNLKIKREKKMSMLFGCFPLRRTKVVTEARESFFSFFDESPTTDTATYKVQVEKDFAVGELLRVEVIPNAVLYFTRDRRGEGTGGEGCQ